MNVRTASAAKGTADHRIQGRNCPHRVRVRSAIAPIIGSVKASEMRTTKNSVPAAAAEIPNVSV